jgi:hypothetical protein
MRALTARSSLSHLLGVNQFFTDLAAHARTHPGARLERWWNYVQCTRPHARCADGATSTLGRSAPDGSL